MLGPYRSTVEALAKGKNVDFVGSPNDDDLSVLYKASGHTLFPSVSAYGDQRWKRPELLGLVALESLSCGTPVIGSDVGGLGEVLAMTSQTAVPPGDVPAWHAAMNTAISAGATVVPPSAGMFTWDATAERSRRLYRQVLGKNVA